MGRARLISSSFPCRVGCLARLNNRKLLPGWGRSFRGYRKELPGVGKELPGPLRLNYHLNQ